jgi:hypothetical protein
MFIDPIIDLGINKETNESVAVPYSAIIGVKPYENKDNELIEEDFGYVILRDEWVYYFGAKIYTLYTYNILIEMINNAVRVANGIKD